MGAGLITLASAAALRANAAPTARSISDDPEVSDLLRDRERFDRSLSDAYDFLDSFMDAYASGSTLRLIQSYAGNPDSGLETTGFTYDNALVIHAYLASGDHDALARAQILGDALLYAQAHNFPAHDGRFAQAYFTGSPDASGVFVAPAAAPFYFYTSAVGDQCWAGLALAQLYARTGKPKYLKGAIAVANWIATNHYDTRGPGGFTWGTTIDQFNNSVPSGNGKSTEHNIDAYAFFSMLAHLTNGHASNGMSWSALAAHARSFTEAMFNAAGGYFYVGTNADQITPGTGIIAEDCQTWSYLALLCPQRGVSIDWVLTHLKTIDTPSAPNTGLTNLGNIAIEGETFDTASLAGNPQSNDPHAVWLEGTAHTATALLVRRKHHEPGDPFQPGDVKTAVWLLENCRLAQQKLGAGQVINHQQPAGNGLVAATGVCDTGFGYTYGPTLHIGATAWYIMALQAANPYRLGYRDLH